MTEFAIKVKMPHAKKFKFLTPGGGLNGLTIHAARFKDKAKAQEICDNSASQNPGTEWKVVPLGGAT